MSWERVTLGFGEGPLGDVVVARPLRTWWERLRGLLGTRLGDGCAQPVLLVHCDSVHTFGMAYAIDIALMAADGSVVHAERGVRPGHVVSAHGSVLVLERPSTEGPWPVGGEHVQCLSWEKGSGAIPCLERGAEHGI